MTRKTLPLESCRASPRRTRDRLAPWGRSRRLSVTVGGPPCDGYYGYSHLTDTLHAWCGAHLLRVLRFATRPDLDIFTNNETERTIRSVKVQQRSSGGCWRTLQGLADFAVVQSYLSTAAKWGLRAAVCLLCR
jgi:hypothetical protein